MAIRSDYHIHSSFSADSETPMEEQIAAAIACGLTSICFTEHVDLDFPYRNTPEDETDMPFVADHDRRKEAFLPLKEQFASRIALHFGVELGLFANSDRDIAAVEEYAARYDDYDFILGSTHSVDGYDPYYDSYFDAFPEDPVRVYLEAALKNVQTFSCFDSYGHLDYVLRYAFAHTKEEEHKRIADTSLSFSSYMHLQHEALIEEILKTLIRKDKALEINTQSLKKGYPETNPGISILKRYKELGGHLITVGSDAHLPDFVGAGFSDAAAVLQAAGFDTYYTFEKRVPVPHKL